MNMSRHQNPSPTDNRRPGPSGQRQRRPASEPRPGADEGEDGNSTPGDEVPPIEEERGPQNPEKLPGRPRPPQRV